MQANHLVGGLLLLASYGISLVTRGHIYRTGNLESVAIGGRDHLSLWGEILPQNARNPEKLPFLHTPTLRSRRVRLW